MPCSSSCPTQDHQSWGACVRSKRLQIADVDARIYNGSQTAAVNSYVKAREAGLQPEGISKPAVEKAWRETERTGVPYRADA